MATHHQFVLEWKVFHPSLLYFFGGIVTDQFLPAAKRQGRAEDICTILTSIMACGCDIGLHTMAQMREGGSYKQIKHIFDWQITDEARRGALADVVEH